MSLYLVIIRKQYYAVTWNLLYIFSPLSDCSSTSIDSLYQLSMENIYDPDVSFMKPVKNIIIRKVNEWAEKRWTTQLTTYALGWNVDHGVQVLCVHSTFFHPYTFHVGLNIVHTVHCTCEIVSCVGAAMIASGYLTDHQLSIFLNWRWTSHQQPESFDDFLVSTVGEDRRFTLG